MDSLSSRANAAPVVTAGSDRTANEGEAIAFKGSFTDLGILDTHTIAWDFGDGTLVTDTLEATHTYTNNGIYTVNLTVTDNNSATNKASKICITSCFSCLQAVSKFHE